MPDAPHDYLADAQRFQAEQVAYLRRGDIEDLVANLYTEDARMESFVFHAEGRPAIEEVIRSYGERTADLTARSVERMTAGRDYIWFELAMENPQEPQAMVRSYEFKFLREGRTSLELFGLKQGGIWKPGDLPGAALPGDADAIAFHDRYVQYHIAGDADALVDEMFTDDARMVTFRFEAEGKEAVRQVFRDIFARESGFTPRSVEKITAGRDYIWFEASVSSSLGDRRLYDVMMLRDGKIYLQFVGVLEGAMPTEKK